MTWRFPVVLWFVVVGVIVGVYVLAQNHFISPLSIFMLPAASVGTLLVGATCGLLAEEIHAHRVTRRERASGLRRMARELPATPPPDRRPARPIGRASVRPSNGRHRTEDR
jgi:hypothetical protein